MILDVRRRRHGVDEEADVVLAAGAVELTAALELVGERERIDDAAALGDRHHRAEDPAVPLGVEHRVVDDFDRAQHRVLVDQHRGQHRLLGVLRVWRTPIAVRVTPRRAGAIEYSTGELDIFPGGALPGRIPEERGGVIRDDQRHAVVAVNLASQLADRELRLQQRLRRERPEREDHLRADQLDLPNEVRTARLNFFRQRIAVSRRTMLEDVADEDVLARADRSPRESS